MPKTVLRWSMPDTDFDGTCGREFEAETENTSKVCSLCMSPVQFSTVPCTRCVKTPSTFRVTLVNFLGPLYSFADQNPAPETLMSVAQIANVPISKTGKCQWVSSPVITGSATYGLWKPIAGNPFRIVKTRCSTMLKMIVTLGFVSQFNEGVTFTLWTWVSEFGNSVVTPLPKNVNTGETFSAENRSVFFSTYTPPGINGPNPSPVCNPVNLTCNYSALRTPANQPFPATPYRPVVQIIPGVPLPLSTVNIVGT